MKMECGIGRRRKSRDERRQRQRDDFAAAPQCGPRRRRMVGRREQFRHADLDQRHQPERRRERHLKARMHQRLRRDRQHDHRGDRQRAERDGAAIDHDRDQHHRRHEERALGRDLGAGQQEIERRGCERRSSGPFLDRKRHRQRRDQRQQRADRKEHDAGDDGHVIAGNREHMAEPGNEHGVVDRRR